MQKEFYNFIYNEHQKVIFAYIPKVACSNWKCVMRYMEGHGNYLDTRFAHDRKIGGLTFLDQVPERMDILKDPKVRKFACVRDPYTRILSAYLNKVADRLPVSNTAETTDYFDLVVRNIEEFRSLVLDPVEFPEITFEVFLMWLDAEYSHFTNDEHWRRQTELLHLPPTEFDFLGRFETLSEDAANILDQMQCDIDFPTQNQIRFAPTHARQKAEIYYSATCRAFVDKMYSDDFNALGYAT